MSLLETHKNLEEMLMSKDDDDIVHINKKKKILSKSKYATSEKETKKHKKLPFTDKIYNKICAYINDIKEIDKVVPFCQEKHRRELLLDRGLLLCLKVNEYIEDMELNIDDVLNHKKENIIEVDLKLLDENYWMNQKVDKYARTEQRKRIPQERWFMLKDNSFTPNLKKCFALNREKFIDTYNWLNSLEKNN